MINILIQRIVPKWGDDFKRLKCVRNPGLAVYTCIILLFMFFINDAFTQVVSPLKGGHYPPAVKNICDIATPPPGLFLIWYNVYALSSKYFDKNGTEFNSIRLDQIHPALPNNAVDLTLNAIASIPGIFWASSFKILGGARYIAGISPSYTNADASIITERGGIVIGTTYTHSVSGKVSGIVSILGSGRGSKITA